MITMLEEYAGSVLLSGGAGFGARMLVEWFRHRQCDWQDGYDQAHDEMQGKVDKALDQADKALDRAEAAEDAEYDAVAELKAVRAQWNAERVESPTLVGAVHSARRHDTGTQPSARRNLAQLARERFDDLPDDDDERPPSAPLLTAARRAEHLNELAPDALDDENGKFGQPHERDSDQQPDPYIDQITAQHDVEYDPALDMAHARATAFQPPGGITDSKGNVYAVSGQAPDPYASARNAEHEHDAPTAVLSTLAALPTSPRPSMAGPGAVRCGHEDMLPMPPVGGRCWHCVQAAQGWQLPIAPVINTDPDFEISTDEFAAALATVARQFGEIPEPLQRVVDAGGRFALPESQRRGRAPMGYTPAPERPRPRLVRTAPAATGQIPKITDATVFAESAFVTDLMGERGATESKWFRDHMAEFSPETRLAIGQ